MADNQYTDARIYGGSNAPLPDLSAAKANPSADVPTTPQAFIGSGVSPGLEAEGAAVQAEGNRERASLFSSIGASASQWATKRIWDAATQPTFAPKDGYNPAQDVLTNVRFQPDEDETEFLLKSRSPEEFAFRNKELTDQRDARQKMGDNPLTSMLTSMVDPVYLGIDVASLGVGRLASAARTGRVVAGITAAAGATGVGMIEREVAPVTYKEVLLNALINGAGTALLFNPKTRRLEPVDPEHPGQTLGESIQGLTPEPTPSPTTQWVQKLDEAGQPVLDRRGNPLYVRSEQEIPLGASRAEAAQVRAVQDEALGLNPSSSRRATEGAAARRANEENVFYDIERPAPRAVPVLTGKSGAVYKSLGAKAVTDWIIGKGDALLSPLARTLAERAGPMLDNLKVYVMSDADLAASGSGRPRYLPKEHAVYLSHSTPADLALHEVAHAATVEKIHFGRANPESAHAGLVRELDDIRTKALEVARARGTSDDLIEYLSKNTEEFVAGLYTGKSTFTDLLHSMPDPTPQKSLLGRAVDVVRKFLGMGLNESSALVRAMKLTDDLIDTPLVKGAQALTESFGAPAAQASRTVGQRVDSMAKKVGDTLAWNLHKTLAKYNRRIADMLVDDPLNMTADSVVSQQRAIRSGLTEGQYRYEDQLMAAMSDQGIGVLQRVTQPTRALQVQQAIERDVAMEMWRREDAARRGIQQTSPAPRHIQEMADTLDRLSAETLGEMQRAGVRGAEELSARSGYFARRWDSGKLENVIERMQQYGWDQARTMGRLGDMLAGSMARANGWAAELSQDVARAVLDRALRKGEFTDSAFRAHIGNEGLAEIRDILTGSGIRGDRLQRAMDALAGQVDEAGKSPHLKHRIDLDLRATMLLPDGSTMRLTDLLDTGIANITDRYLDAMSGQAALARKGLRGPTEIGALREQLLSGIDGIAQRGEAAKLFDNVMNLLHGRPVGDEMPQALRKLQAVTQMVGLASSGLLQVTEYSTAMAKYGLGKTLRYALNNMPGFRGLFDSVLTDRALASDLSNVLSRQSYQDIRMRPFIQRMEDNFDIPVSDQVQLGLQQAKQIVPYLNAMKFVHHHQAQTVANLVSDLVVKGAEGNAKALRLLEQYGLDSHSMQGLAADIRQHGLDTARWSDATWDRVRGPLAKMMDESVLRSRTGEIPAFAQFSQVGKFIFTFRSFVLGAHNKVLAGGLARSGLMGVGLMSLYQFPLALLATQTSTALKGQQDKINTPEKLAAMAISQMGVLGLFSDVWGAVSGQKQQFGAPGLIAVDRAFGMLNHLGSGNFGSAANDVINTVPLLPLIPGIKAIGETLK